MILYNKKKTIRTLFYELKTSWSVATGKDNRFRTIKEKLPPWHRDHSVKEL